MSKKIHYLVLLILIFVIPFCAEKTRSVSENDGTSVKELNEYQVLEVDQDLILGLPVRLKFNTNKRELFVQDLANWSVISIDSTGKMAGKYGRRGRGPGEIQRLDDFFFTNEHLYIVDGAQFLIHKYSLENGEYLSSLNYGDILMKMEDRENNRASLIPKLPLIDNNNQPFVTLNGEVLIPSGSGGRYLYQLTDWEGNKLANIAEMPLNCSATEEEVRKALKERVVPASDECLTFPVYDHSNPDELYIVYSAVPKIEKYKLSGEKLWTKLIPEMPEMDSLMIDLEEVARSDPGRTVSHLTVRKYIAGRSGNEGDLYLLTYNNLVTPETPVRPVWIHHFDKDGELIERLKIKSEQDLNYYPGIDFVEKRMYMPVFRDIEIRSYSF